MSLVNVNASHNSGFGFTSTVDPRTVNLAALPAISNNVQAAAASKIVGGKRVINRRKINKISGKYKMKGSRRRASSRRRSHSRRRSLKQKGGYAQFYNNMPNTPSYSTGGHLSPSLSALASPVPYQLLGNEPDNYNHFTNSGFPSKGWH